MQKVRIRRIIVVSTFCLSLVFGSAAVATGADISGHWWGSNGAEYDITQVGTTFNWKVPATGEIGVGTITGKDCSAAWPFGFATGKIITNPSDIAVEIVWSNGVIFQRPAPGSGPGPTPGPTPGPAPTPGGELSYTFGPNPAWGGAEVWVNLSLPVAHEIKVWHNGAVMPIINFKGNNFVVVKLPMSVTSGPLRVEYQGRRIEANQPNKNLDIKPPDIGGNWSNKGNLNVYSLNQNNNTYTITWTNPGPLFPPGVNTGNGETYGGNKLNVHWGKKPPSMNLNDVGTITDIDANGRARTIKWNSGDTWTRP